MTAFLSVLAIVVLGALVVWVASSIALRILGALVIFGSLWGLWRETAPFLSLLMLVMGLLLWLAGHWLYAYREHEYRGPLVERIFYRVLPRRFDPTRHWGYRVHHTHTHHQAPPAAQPPPTRPPSDGGGS